MPLRSMTGYGSAERDGLRMELRGVNGRYLELKIRQPFGAAMEARLRKRLERSFGRGRVELSVSHEPGGGGALASLGVDPEALRGLLAALDSVGEERPELSSPNRLEVLDFLVRKSARSEPVLPDEELVAGVLDEVIVQAKQMRETEGEHLRGVLAQLAAQLRDEVRAIESSLIGEAERLHGGLMARFEDALSRFDGEVDEARVAQELALVLQKGDVSEELARLESHFTQWSSVLAETASAGQGKRLDFLTQEMLREVTTIGSKITAHLGSARVIEAKAIIERMREQVQNVE